MPDISLYWHDYETFGVDPRRDYPFNLPAKEPTRI